MWFVWLKIMYDSFPVVRVLFWIFVIYLIVGVTYSMYGWIGIGALVLLVLTIVVSIWWDIHHPRT